MSRPKSIQQTVVGNVLGHPIPYQAQVNDRRLAPKGAGVVDKADHFEIFDFEKPQAFNKLVVYADKVKELIKSEDSFNKALDMLATGSADIL